MGLLDLIKKNKVVSIIIAILLVIALGALIYWIYWRFAPHTKVLDDAMTRAGKTGMYQSQLFGQGMTGMYQSPPSQAGCPLPGSQLAAHSDLIPEYLTARTGADQPFLQNHPLEEQARARHAALYNNPQTPCFEPADHCYDPAQDLLQETDALVPGYQRQLKNLPAMRQMNFQQEFPANNIGPHTRQGIDTLTSTSLDSAIFDESDTFQSRVNQTAGVTDGMAGIYGRGDTKGISMINPKSRMTDPTKLLPRADPSQEKNRMVQAGPSIAEIGSRVPKAADIMKMMRNSSSVLGHTIPRDRPPIYTEGLNAFRQTRLPSRTVQGDCLFGISPVEVSDIIDYYPSPFISSSSNTPYSYQVPGANGVYQ